ncbi:hypothetical protein LTR09_008156 [Extremus antarcticus]|uniref:Restriction endonuclease domain-containing protein n=1 Tax=Extremus antarcticus TaxID=702011 RepID=A0AAJ0GAB1_9PEZI|nr:hypothetical protein LTR09_008156 [Extremus antarcticus]
MSLSKAPDTPSPEPPTTATTALPPSPPQSPKQHDSPTLRSSPSTAQRSPRLSPIDRLLGTLKLRKAGRPLGFKDDWLTFRLSTSEFADFERRLEQDEDLWGWYGDKVKYDWDAPEREGAKGEYILRMPSALHEIFIVSVVAALSAGISELADRVEKDGGEDGQIVAEQLRKVDQGGSPTLEMRAPSLENSSQETAGSGEAEEERVVRRSPDVTFFHPEQPGLPTLVVEVAYSQQQKALPRLAESYVVDSQHRIRCVVGLDIPYVRSEGGKTKNIKGGKEVHKRATLSIWRPGTEKDENDEEVGVCTTAINAASFRDSAGTTCDGALEIRVSDLLPADSIACLPTSLTNETFRIDYTDLATALSRAEERTAKAAEPRTRPATTMKFRKRKRTPSEEVSDEREAEEVRRVEKAMEADGEWGARVRRRLSPRGVEARIERRRSLRRRDSCGRGVGSGS